MPRLLWSGAAASDLAMGANSAAQAAQAYRAAGHIDRADGSAKRDDIQDPHQAKIDEATAQARLAVRFLVQFLERHAPSKADQRAAGEIKRLLDVDATSGTDGRERGQRRLRAAK